MDAGELFDQIMAAAWAALPRWVPRKAFDDYVEANRSGLVAWLAESPRFAARVVGPASPANVRPPPEPRSMELDKAEQWLRQVEQQIQDVEGQVENDEDRAVLAALEEEWQDASRAVLRAGGTPPQSGLRFTVRKYGLSEPEARHLLGHERRDEILRTLERWRMDVGLPAMTSALTRGKLFELMGWDARAGAPAKARWSGRADHEDRRERRVERLKAGDTSASVKRDSSRTRAATTSGRPTIALGGRPRTSWRLSCGMRASPRLYDP